MSDVLPPPPTCQDSPKEVFHQDTASFTMVHYSQLFSYLNDLQCKEKHIKLQHITLIPPLQSYSIEFFEIQQKPQKQGSQTEVKIVEVVGEDQVSLKDLKILLPSFGENRVVKVVVKSQGKSLWGTLPHDQLSSSIKLFNSNGRKHGQLHYDFRPSSQHPESLSSDLEDSLIYQQLGRPKSKVASIPEESSQQENLLMPQLIEGQVLNSCLQADLGSSNQFLPAPKEFTFCKEEASQHSPDVEQDPPIRGHLSPKRDLTTMIQKALIQTKFNDCPRNQTVKDELPPYSSPSRPTSNHQQVAKEQTLLTPFQRYHHFQELRQQEKEHQKSLQKSRQQHKYDLVQHKMNSIQRSEKEELNQQYCMTPQKQSSPPSAYKTPLQLSRATSREADTQIEHLNRSPPSPNIHAFTNKIYLRKFIQTSNSTDQKAQLGQAEGPRQNYKEESRNSLERKPGFITTVQKNIGFSGQQTTGRLLSSSPSRHTKATSVVPSNSLSFQEQAVQSSSKSILLPTISRPSQFYRNGTSNNTISETEEQEHSKCQPKIKVTKKDKSLCLKTKDLTRSVPKRSAAIRTRTIGNLSLSKSIVDIKLENSASKTPRGEQAVVQAVTGADGRDLGTRQASNKDIQATCSHHLPQTLQKLPLVEPFSREKQESSSAEASLDVIVNNISVNLYSKSFGRKWLELNLKSKTYKTEALHGSHLLWVERGFLFKRVQALEQLEIVLKCQNQRQMVALGQTRVPLAEMLVNYRQSFCQAYLFTPNQSLLAVVIIGFQIMNSPLRPKVPGTKTAHQPIRGTLPHTKVQASRLRLFVIGSINSRNQKGSNTSQINNRVDVSSFRRASNGRVYTEGDQVHMHGGSQVQSDFKRRKRSYIDS